MITSLEDNIRVFLHINNFSQSEHRNLTKIAALVLPHIPRITDEFYERLSSEPMTARYIEGRLEGLKSTHTEWLEALFKVQIDSDFFENQLRIGRTHVCAQIPPLFVAGSMSFLRSVFPSIIEKEMGTTEGAGAISGVILKMLDLCHYLIDHAYEQDRLNRITGATGLSRPLLENLIALKQRA